MMDMRFNQPQENKNPETAEVLEQKSTKNWMKIKKQTVFFGMLILIIIVLGGLTVNFYLKTKQFQQNNSASNMSDDIEIIVAEVAKLIVLPSDETPTIATVQDPEKLRDQPFFNNAKNGDKVLIYSKAQKAILYDPIQKILVEVAPLNIAQ